MSHADINLQVMTGLHAMFDLVRRMLSWLDIEVLVLGLSIEMRILDYLEYSQIPYDLGMAVFLRIDIDVLMWSQLSET